MVYQLVKRLPYKEKSFNLYIDNYYTTQSLLSELRQIGIGACGTVRSDRIPIDLKIPKELINKLEYHYRTGSINDGVATILWVDNKPVTLMTTIHTLTGRSSEIEKLRKKPTKSNPKAATKNFLSNEWIKLLNIPKCIDDYNQNMGGVDTADQLKSYYDTQLITRRNWFPIFFWSLDTILSNTYLIHKDINPKITYKEHRMRIAWFLIAGEEQFSGIIKNHSPSASKEIPPLQHRITIDSSINLPPCRKAPGDHWPMHLDDQQRRYCFYCRWEVTRDGQKEASRTIWKCTFCNIPLCLSDKKNCFTRFHTI
jgi:hypothetical protein